VLISAGLSTVRNIRSSIHVLDHELPYHKRHSKGENNHAEHSFREQNPTVGIAGVAQYSEQDRKQSENSRPDNQDITPSFSRMRAEGMA